MALLQHCVRPFTTRARVRDRSEKAEVAVAGASDDEASILSGTPFLRAHTRSEFERDSDKLCVLLVIMSHY